MHDRFTPDHHDLLDTLHDHHSALPPAGEAAGPVPHDEDEVPTSFGSFKPTGHVMIGLPDAAAQRALRADLHTGGWAPEHVVAVNPAETAEQMNELIDNASPLAGFGSELQMMRRYVEEARRGTRWLLVKADDDEVLQRLKHLAERHGARLAVSYRLLVVEELI